MPSIPHEATVTVTLAYYGERMVGRLNVLRPGHEPLLITLPAEALFELGMNAFEALSTIKGLRRL